MGLRGGTLHGTKCLVMEIGNGEIFKPYPCVGFSHMDQFKEGGEFLYKASRYAVFHLNRM